MDVLGYMLEWKPGDPCFYSVDMFEQESYKDSAKVWALYDSPQVDGKNVVAVYKGKWWVQPKNMYEGRDYSGFVPLYAGKLLFDPSYFDRMLSEAVH